MVKIDGNKAYVGAYKKGVEAYRQQVPLRLCPYPDHRTNRGSITFSRAFRRAWFEGWHDARTDAIEKLETLPPLRLANKADQAQGETND